MLGYTYPGIHTQEGMLGYKLPTNVPVLLLPRAAKLARFTVGQVLFPRLFSRFTVGQYFSLGRASLLSRFTVGQVLETRQGGGIPLYIPPGYLRGYPHSAILASQDRIYAWL